MKKLLLPILLGCLSVSFAPLPETKTASNDNNPVAIASIKTSAENSDDKAASVYAAIQLDQYGLSQEAFEYAWKGYQYLLEKKMISRDQYLTICDFSQSSNNKRLYIIDVINNQLVTNTYVAHGRNSGAEYATKFSNRPESLQSSLGFYITGDTYTGKHGLSLRIDGVEPGINDRAMERTIVIHGAAYVDPARAKTGVFMGRSWGCPAVPENESATVINTIKSGTCLFIYHPGKNYLLGSKILNG
jgi:L,D-transpeptidase catalytic domain